MLISDEVFARRSELKGVVTSKVREKYPNTVQVDTGYLFEEGQMELYVYYQQDGKVVPVKTSVAVDDFIKAGTDELINWYVGIIEANSLN